MRWWIGVWCIWLCRVIGICVGEIIGRGNERREMGLEEGLKRVRIGLIRRIGRFGIRRRYISTCEVDVLFFLVVVQKSTSFVLMVP